MLNSAERTVAFPACTVSFISSFISLANELPVVKLLSPYLRPFNSTSCVTVGPEKVATTDDKHWQKNTTKKPLCARHIRVNNGKGTVDLTCGEHRGFVVCVFGGQRISAPRSKPFLTHSSGTPSGNDGVRFRSSTVECAREGLSRLAKCFALCTSPPSIITQCFVDTNVPQSVTETALARPL